MVADATARGAPLKLVVYPDATHDFDIPDPVPREILGHHIVYDPAATQDAAQRLRDFLHTTLQQAGAAGGSPD